MHRAAHTHLHPDMGSVQGGSVELHLSNDTLTASPREHEREANLVRVRVCAAVQGKPLGEHTPRCYRW